MIARRAFLRLLAGGAAAAALPGCDPAPTDDLLPPFLPFTLTKGPWVHLTGPTTASLRFETREDVDVLPQVLGPDGPLALVEARSSADVALAWGLEISGNPLDEAGPHVLHEIVLEGLTPGADYRWTVPDGSGGQVEGAFQAAPAASADVVIGWIADTMYPASVDVMAALAAQAPQLVIHGGDIQYRTNPADTWNGFFAAMAPNTTQAALHLVFGNHELDTDDEATEYFDRLFAGQGPGPSVRAHVVRFGRAAIVCLDSETGALDDPDSAQVLWARATLAEVAAEGRIPILALHRPTYTLSKYGPRDLGARTVVHALAQDHGVPLVLAGHVHGFERFVVDGVTYLVDGGGGALLTDVDERRDEIAAERPGEPDLRVSAERSFGATLIEVGSARIVLTRVGRDGEVLDRAEISR